MKINKQDEYGLRILLRIAGNTSNEGLTIPQLSDAESMSQPYVGKLTRILRLAGFIKSNRGQKGGYVLAKTPSQITIKEVLSSLGGIELSESQCEEMDGLFKFCTNSVDCSMKSLWTVVQYAIDQVLEAMTLQDLMGNETDARLVLDKLTRVHAMEEAFTV